MQSHKPTKRRSALIAVAPTIPVEIAAISVGVGGAVSIALAFLVFFLVAHQARVARWRRTSGAEAGQLSSAG